LGKSQRRFFPMKVDLTDRTVATAKVGDLFDSRNKGLNLRVTSTGVKTWYLVFSDETGKRARVKLGNYPQVPLAKARTLAIEAKANLDSGIDPRSVDRREAAMTVTDLVRAYLAKHVRPNLRSAKNVERRLLKNVLPVIGDVKLADLHRREVIRVTDAVLERGAPNEAIKVHKDLRAILRWAVDRGELNACPMEGMKPPAEERKRDRVLTDDEIRIVWHGKPLRRQAHRDILRLCLLTGQRIGEVHGMESAEIDLKTRTWTIPASRSKNGNPHTVPLPDAALTIIKNAMKGDGKVFLGAGDTNSIGKHIARAGWGIPQWSAHDTRRTLATNLGKLGVSPIVIAHILNHRSATKAGVTLGVYAIYSYEKEQREALELWSHRLAAIVSGSDAKIIPLHGGATA
jgi:integrase